MEANLLRIATSLWDIEPHPDGSNRRLREQIFAQLPAGLHDDIAAEYRRIYTSIIVDPRIGAHLRVNAAVREANLFLLATLEAWKLNNGQLKKEPA